MHVLMHTRACVHVLGGANTKAEAHMHAHMHATKNAVVNALHSPSVGASVRGVRSLFRLPYVPVAGPRISRS